MSRYGPPVQGNSNNPTNTPSPNIAGSVAFCMSLASWGFINAGMPRGTFDNPKTPVKMMIPAPILEMAFGIPKKVSALKTPSPTKI